MAVQPRLALRRVAVVLNALPLLVSSAFLVLLTCVLGINVIARYGFNSGLPWADEASRFALIWITFLGAAALVRLNQHISVDLFQNALPDSVRRIVRVGVHLLTATVGLLLIFPGIQQVQRQQYQLSPALEISMGWVYTVVPVSGLYMLIYAIAAIFAPSPPGADGLLKQTEL